MILWIAIGCLSLLSTISIFFAIKFAITILRTQDAIEDSLDLLDEKYAKISEILKIPLFYDSKEVRECLRTLEESRNSILNVATTLTKIDVPTDVEHTEDNT